MDAVIYVVAAVFVLILLILLSVLHGGKTKGDEAQPVEREQAALQRRAAVNVGGARRRVGAARNRMRDRQDDSDEEAESEPVALPAGKVGAKKLRKLQEKEERARQREAELQDREERKQRQERQDELRKKREEQEAAEEAVREAEEKALKEQKEKEEYEEYLKLKEQFTVEEEGTDACEFQDTESLLQQFIEYIKDMKVVMLEDLAVHFKLKTQDVIDRIKELQEADRLSGVLDDRGKFIYITKEEYEAVAKFIKQRGRVSIAELAESSNKLINLSPDNQSTHTKLVAKVSS